MCLTVHYTCPNGKCGELSTITDTYPCGRNPCPDNGMTTTRSLLRKHLKSWDCPNEECPFNFVKEEELEREVLQIRGTQASNRRVWTKRQAQLLGIPDGGCSAEATPSASGQVEGGALVSGSSPAPEVNDSIGSSPTQGTGTTVPSTRAQRSAGFRSSPANGLTGSVRRARGPALPRLPRVRKRITGYVELSDMPEETQTRIQHLMSKIPRNSGSASHSSPGRRVQRWTDEENELFRLLRDNDVSFEQMFRDFWKDTDRTKDALFRHNTKLHDLPSVITRSSTRAAEAPLANPDLDEEAEAVGPGVEEKEEEFECASDNEPDEGINQDGISQSDIDKDNVKEHGDRADVVKNDDEFHAGQNGEGVIKSPEDGHVRVKDEDMSDVEEFTHIPEKVADQPTHIPEKTTEQRNNVPEKATEEPNSVPEKVTEEPNHVPEKVAEEPANIPEKVTEEVKNVSDKVADDQAMSGSAQAPLDQQMTIVEEVSIIEMTITEEHISEPKGKENAVDTAVDAEMPEVQELVGEPKGNDNVVEASVDEEMSNAQELVGKPKGKEKVVEAPIDEQMPDSLELIYEPKSKEKTPSTAIVSEEFISEPKGKEKLIEAPVDKEMPDTHELVGEPKGKEKVPNTPIASEAPTKIKTEPEADGPEHHRRSLRSVSKVNYARGDLRTAPTSFNRAAPATQATATKATVPAKRAASASPAPPPKRVTLATKLSASARE
ncbi:hypothetical protein B0H63DRAFT_509838 [Podospora didyma]|uniref:Uncharacterized protein n=1 Tax=Podospora didyma TaxID=330526 RepID=A0AAE0NNP0_9PEZI|nr:hypothetical protein B0H63DRAFT_509838 [Podospora didyma]